MNEQSKNLCNNNAATKEIQLTAGTLRLNITTEKVPLEKVSYFASRRNNLRGFLFVSKVLGKHYPVRPCEMRQIYRQLAGEIVSTIGTESGAVEPEDSFLALAMAETATGFGAGIYEEFCRLLYRQSLFEKQSDSKEGSTVPAIFCHSTRYHDSRVAELLSFEEPHSHASGHWLTAPPAEMAESLAKTTTLLLLDDEQSTGTTAENAVRKLIPFLPHLQKVVVVSILNWMGGRRKEEFAAHFPGLTIHFPALISGSMEFMPRADFRFDTLPQSVGNGENKDAFLAENSGRRWYRKSPQISAPIIEQAEEILQKNAAENGECRPILVLGTGEFTFLPFLFAEELEKRGREVFFQSTTRSPILVEKDTERSCINSVIPLSDNYGEGVANFVYNVIPEKYRAIFICYETEHNRERHQLPEELEGLQKVYKLFLQ